MTPNQIPASIPCIKICWTRTTTFFLLFLSSYLPFAIMTRVTNFGIKRKYLEAGFDNDKPQPEAVEVQPPAASESALSSVTGPPAKKQKEEKKGKKKEGSAAPSEGSADPGQPKRPRKRHRSKKGKGPLGYSQALKGQEKAKEKTDADVGVDVKEKLAGWKKKAEGGKGRPLEDQSKALARSRIGALLAQFPSHSKLTSRILDDPREARRLKRREEKRQSTTCFACREKGHAAKDCPKTSELAKGVVATDPTDLEEDETMDSDAPQQKQVKAGPVVGICYRSVRPIHHSSASQQHADLFAGVDRTDIHSNAAKRPSTLIILCHMPRASYAQAKVTSQAHVPRMPTKASIPTEAAVKSAKTPLISLRIALFAETVRILRCRSLCPSLIKECRLRCGQERRGYWDRRRRR